MLLVQLQYKVEQTTTYIFVFKLRLSSEWTHKLTHNAHFRSYPLMTSSQSDHDYTVRIVLERKEKGRKEGRERERERKGAEGERERGRERGREGGREEGKEGGRERGREGGRERGREKGGESQKHMNYLHVHTCLIADYMQCYDHDTGQYLCNDHILQMVTHKNSKDQQIQLLLKTL